MRPHLSQSRTIEKNRLPMFLIMDKCIFYFHKNVQINSLNLYGTSTFSWVGRFLLVGQNLAKIIF